MCATEKHPSNLKIQQEKARIEAFSSIGLRACGILLFGNLPSICHSRPNISEN
jgi:hypothetical protein